MQRKSVAPGIEVSGRGIEFAVEAFKLVPSVGKRYLTKYGFGVANVDGKTTSFDTSTWYSLDRWLELFESINREVGSNVMFTIGQRCGSSVGLPPDVKDVHGALAAIDLGYHAFHRLNGHVMLDAVTGRMLEGIGHYHYRPGPGDKQIVVICEVPYPCDVDMGLIAGFAGRFQPRARVVHDNGAPCRKNGAESCTYIVTW